MIRSNESTKTIATVQSAAALHQEVLELQDRMQAASEARDAAVANAVADGASLVEIAAAMGVSRQRVWKMASNGR